MSPTVVTKVSKTRATKLRQNMNDGEKRLWWELRQFRKQYGLHVRRQAPIGRFIVDFVIQSKKLVIEVDGEHHFTKEHVNKDRLRDQWLRQRGYEILRINTGELADNFEGCVEQILFEAGVI